MKIGVIGTGHVGLITCVTMSAVGHEVVGVDADPEKIQILLDGGCPFFEPGLQELLDRQITEGGLRFTDSLPMAVEGAEVVFISVGTPPRASGEANLIAVENSATQVAEAATDDLLIVEKSTVPVGTAVRLRTTIERLRARSDGRIEVASNPEFLREGHAIDDAMEPDRILVGVESTWARDRMRSVYAPWIEKGVPFIETDIATAELAKHACNAFLALKISFVNALARICERAGADIEGVTTTMGSDPRIGGAFLRAGLGYGGSCFPKDLAAFEHLSKTLGYDFRLLQEVARINDEAVDAVIAKVKDALWNLEEKKIALLGLSFKPGTDDVRFAPSLRIATDLIDAGATVVGYDPVANNVAANDVPGLLVADGPYEAAAGAHCLIVCTEWEEFRKLDLVRLKDEMAYPVIVDGRNIFDLDQMEAAGFTCYSVGRRSVTQ